ncbi:MAG: hypothetical protein ACRYFU_24735 [Janthinobacterium lividum]
MRVIDARVMDVRTEPRILAALKMGNGVLIEFDDGQCAMFSAFLLHETLPLADQVMHEEDRETEG